MTEDELKFTGERMVPGKVDLELLLEHIARYRFALEYAEGRNVLDAASGSGYGTYMLAQKAAHVTGVDISTEAIEYARHNFSSGNITFEVCDVLSLSFKNDTFNLVTAFEIFEHINEPSKLISELIRVTQKNGSIMLSTPNAEYLKSTTENPYHVKEYTFDEFSQIIDDSKISRVEYFFQSPKSGIGSMRKYYMQMKKTLGIGPILKKKAWDVQNRDELMTLEIPYDFTKDKSSDSQFLIAVITV